MSFPASAIWQVLGSVDAESIPVYEERAESIPVCMRELRLFLYMRELRVFLCMRVESIPVYERAESIPVYES